MRTTLDIDADVLAAAKERAKAEGRTAGAVLSDLARRGLSGPPRRTGQASLGHADQQESFLGFTPLPKRGGIVTNELVDALREEIGE